MSRFKELVASVPGSRHILQGNEAFALGVVHAGYHAADGYPGTPSTEVIDKYLSEVQDKLVVGWSVSEAVATAVTVGHAVAGSDAVVTMKIPGVFQAGDAITTSAFYTAQMGAFVIYAATDYVPSSTQHVIDARHFFAAARVPVLEPRDHQEMYDIAFIAADMSRKFRTQVVILASGILAHSEGLVTTRAPRTVEKRPLPENLHGWMLMPNIARQNYNAVNRERIPQLLAWGEQETALVNEHIGKDDFGVIVVGESDIIVREALTAAQRDPSILSMSLAYPVPTGRIAAFAKKVKGKLFVFEDGDRFLEEKIRVLGIPVVGKEEHSVITDWTPDMALEVFSKHLGIALAAAPKPATVKPVPRPPSICPGCPYRAFALAAQKLKKQKKLYASFGEIGCSTLLHFFNAVDTILCMGGSDGMRQGFVLSRPDHGAKVISVIGDSCECHSGLDGTRNAVFRNVPGVKILLDNRITAMTGGQPAPTSPKNLAGMANKFSLRDAIAAEKCRMVACNSYDLKEVERLLIEALALAEKGEFTCLILEGACIQETEAVKKRRVLTIDRDKCKQCGQCGICPGMEHDEKKRPNFTSLCTNCGSSTQICRQRCPFGAIVPEDAAKKDRTAPPDLPKAKEIAAVTVDKKKLPGSLRVAIRGIGGQGNLFFGKVLSEVALRTPYAESGIVKGDTHGMAQMGGPVISTFACGEVHSPILAPGSADVLVVMEMSEVLRPGFLDLLKPGGTVILNRFAAVPVAVKKEEYPAFDDIKKTLTGYRIIELDALAAARGYGDTAGRTANVVVLGLLSTIAPFNAIPEDIWLAALMAVSPADAVKSANQIAFAAGRGLGK
ncbi:MAG TPA: 2-oxoacid:acceptor oxidoreductase family protein [bacterium]|nr:2-oxoacid:acceptor oxidoreductase family protein [bacterium]